jgi:hypothetical protein
MGAAESWTVLLQALGALVAVLGLIFGIPKLIAAVREVSGPKLGMSLVEPIGELGRWGDSPQAPLCYWYHVRVVNNRKPLAKNVSVKLVSISKPAATSEFPNGTLANPLRLNWAAERLDRSVADIAGEDSETLNLGYINTEEPRFKLDINKDPWPANFQGFIRANERMRVELVAVAENARSEPLRLEISWDGEWRDDPDRMRRHLIIRKVPLDRSTPLTGAG